MSATTLSPLHFEEATIHHATIAPYWQILADHNVSRWSRLLGLITLPLIGVALYMALFYAPREATMGDAQRIFYFHVPSAWIGFLAFFIVFVSSILYLVKGEQRWDALALSAAEIGVVFTTLVLLTGPLWAKAAWGAFWVWDARLTTTLILWIIYIGYLMLRAVADSRRMARLAAMTGILGFLNVPLIYISVVWWRTMHPTLMINDSGGLDPAMRLTLMVALASFTVLFAWLLLVRLRLELKRHQFESLRAEAEA
jgi:heme exporter protein C